ncbi:MAG: hypothetical protein DCC68_25295 [Planctomycetota bacterium]|nr:MAG: hypothetical protein DCC68_25295 [Planctomycetota bacterium]
MHPRYQTHARRRAAIRLARQRRTERPNAAVTVEVELPLAALGGASPVVGGEVETPVARLTLAEWLARPAVATTLF